MPNLRHILEINGVELCMQVERYHMADTIMHVHTALD